MMRQCSVRQASGSHPAEIMGIMGDTPGHYGGSGAGKGQGGQPCVTVLEGGEEGVMKQKFMERGMNRWILDRWMNFDRSTA